MGVSLTNTGPFLFCFLLVMIAVDLVLCAMGDPPLSVTNLS